MTTDLVDLRPLVYAETGFYLDDGTIDLLLAAGVEKFNAEAGQPALTVTGTTLDRDLDVIERRTLVICAVVLHLTGRMIQSSENAVSETNATGRLDLTGVELAMAKRRTEIQKELDKLLERLKARSGFASVTAKELGETLDIAPIAPLWANWPQIPFGLP